MATTTYSSDPIGNRTRWGGAMMGLGMVLLIAGFSLFVFGVMPAEPNAAPAEIATSYVQASSTLEASAYLTIFGGTLVAVGAFFLVTRPMETRRNFPASAFWLFVAISGLLLAAMSVINATGLLVVARAQAAEPVMFEALWRTLDAGWGLAMLTLAVGTIGLAYGEARAIHAAMPVWLSYLALAGGVLVGVAGVGTLTGIDALEVLYFGTYLVLLPLTFLGVRLAYPSLLGGAAGAERRSLRA
jgi:hypothetical protein